MVRGSEKITDRAFKRLCAQLNVIELRKKRILNVPCLPVKLLRVLFAALNIRFPSYSIEFP